MSPHLIRVAVIALLPASGTATLLSTREGTGSRRPRQTSRFRQAFAVGIALAGLPGPATGLAAGSHVRFEVDLRAGESAATARIAVRQDSGALREIALDRALVRNIAGDGRITVENDRLRWVPPATGGILRYKVALSHRRQGARVVGHDAWVGTNFAVFRGEDAFPIRSWRRARGSSLNGELAIRLPRNWALVTPYPSDARGRLTIMNPGSRLPRPVGWITAGDLGIRRDRVGDIVISVTAPRGLRMERVAMLGILRWTLPQLVPQLTTVQSRPHRINIVAAGTPMWLGALSGPNSIFVHADRPLISENGTSTIVHEMVHVLLADLATPPDQDWIDEGLAEFLSLRAMRDSGTISSIRYDATIAEFRRWGGSVQSLRTSSASGPVTARAVTLFHDLDAELRAASHGRQSVAMLILKLMQSTQRADLELLRTGAQRVLGKPARALAATAVPGFK